MGKYFQTQDDIFFIFDSEDWKAENIKTFPANYSGNAKEFIRVNIVLGDKGVNRISISGQLIIDIFTKADEGPAKGHQLSDILDSFLENKSRQVNNTTTQFFTSNMTPQGKDTLNPSLFRYQYVIPFSHFGVFQ
jgi:hypothetical protein